MTFNQARRPKGLLIGEYPKLKTMAFMPSLTREARETLYEINIFCEKTTVLAEKVFHPAAGEAQLKAFVTC